MARLDPEASRFYGHVYEAARAGCLKSLCASGCDDEEAEEIFAGALADVIDEVDPIARHFDPPQMVNFLKTSCRNRLLDGRRHDRVLSVLDLDDWVEKVDDVRLGDLDRQAAVDETMSELWQALRLLPERERAVFCQRHLYGLTPQEIQRRENLSPRSYRKLIERANARVYTYLRQLRGG